MQLALLAWRNIWRNIRRTLLTAGAVAFACMILSFTIALQQSTYKTAIEASTSIFQGHLQVQRTGFQDNPKAHRTLKLSSDLKEQIEASSQIESSTPRIQMFALLSSEERSAGVQVFGVNPEGERRLSTIPLNVREGRYLTQRDANEIVIGSTLAENLRVGVGEELTLLGQGADGSMAAAVLSVVGIFRSGSSELDRVITQIPFGTAQEIFYLPEQAHSLVLKSTDLTQSEAIKSELAKRLSNFDDQVVLSWEELNPGLKESIELDMVSGWVFFFSLVLIIALGVLNTFLMSLLERTREFGLLLSLGMSPFALVKMVALELLSLVAIGFIPGISAGALIILYLSAYGFSVPGSEDINQLWNLPAALYPEFDVLYLLTGPFVVVVTIFLIVLPFSLRLVKLQPIEALRSV